MPMTSKRSYNRRSDRELITDYESRIAELKKKLEAKARPDLELLGEIPRLQRRLREFAQMAMQSSRPDIANSTMAFMAGLERMKDELPEEPKPRRGAAAE